MRMNFLPRIEFRMAVVTFHGRKGHYISEGPIIPPSPTLILLIMHPCPRESQIHVQVIEKFKSRVSFENMLWIRCASDSQTFCAGNSVSIPPARRGKGAFKVFST